VVVVGATASALPDPLFAAGADVVAGAAVDDPDAVRAAVRAGACGTDLHDAGLRKGVVAAADAAGVDLTPERTDGRADETTDGSAVEGRATNDHDAADTADASETSEP